MCVPTVTSATEACAMATPAASSAMPAMAMAGSCRKPATRSGLRQGAFEKVEAVLAPEQLAVQFEGRRAENLNLHRLLGIRLVDRLHRRAVGRGEQHCRVEAAFVEDFLQRLRIADIALLGPDRAAERIGQREGLLLRGLPRGNDQPARTSVL